MGLQERMQERWERRTAPARAAASMAEARDMLTRSMEALRRGAPAEVEARARAMMAAHADAKPGSAPYWTAWECLALAQLGENSATVSEYTGLIDAARAVPGTELKVLEWRIYRAGQLALLARYDQAEADCRAAIGQCPEVTPRQAGDALRFIATSYLTIVLEGRGQIEEAETLARSSLGEAASTAELPANVVSLLQLSLARILNAQQRYQEAELTLQDLRPDTAQAIVAVTYARATARLGLGKLREAEEGARAALDAGTRALSPVNHLTLQAGTLLGATLARQGKSEEARSQLTANAAAWAENFGPDHPKTLAAQQELARIPGDE